MRIAYVAKHDSGSNDDEGAVAHGLASLGHEVLKIQERAGARALMHRPDFLLFHKWRNAEAVRRFRCPKVFWYFDLVSSGGDPTMAERDKDRQAWMAEMTPTVDIGFCTDGDWVNADKTGKLVRLVQGADARITGRRRKSQVCPTCNEAWQGVDLLFTGTRRGGQLRESFMIEMTAAYGPSFTWLESGTYREALADLIANSKIVLAPDGPMTDNYWSNRVYIVQGFGGFLMHPWCETLAPQYAEDREIVYYRSREELHDKIAYYLVRPKDREAMQQAALERTLAEHTYTHRCAELVKTVKERLF